MRPRQMHVERPGGARPGQLDGAQPIAEALLDLGEEAGIVERQDRAARLSSSVQVMQERLPVSGRMANGPDGQEMLDGARRGAASRAGPS